MGLITQTNEEYYAGQKAYTIIQGSSQKVFSTSFDLELELSVDGVSNSNFNLEYSTDGINWSNYIFVNPTVQLEISVDKKTITIPSSAPAIGSTTATTIARITLKDYAKWENYGGYQYISFEDIVNNFLVAYVGEDKLIPKVKRTDVMFHAKRGVQEFNYDTLKSIRSQELTIPPSLSLVIPQDYVNYVELSYIDSSGVKHIIYPTTLTSNPYTVPLQDDEGLPVEDAFAENLEGTSLINKAWRQANQNKIDGQQDWNNVGVWDWNWWKLMYGERYGLDPQYSQSNGWFTIDEREGKFSFSSNLVGNLILLQYVSDGVDVDSKTKIPKMAEEAMYMHIAYGILSGRANVQEYIVQRFRKRRSAELRNAKIRLSNIKLNEISQVMRGKSKWIKH